MAFKALEWLLDRCLLWAYKKAEVARFRDIALADSRQKSPHFKTTLLASLQLIENYDKRRFRRVQQHIKWIANVALGSGMGAKYDSTTQTCLVDFVEPRPDDTKSWHKTFYMAHYATTIIHEATHGLLISRGIAYTSELRSRVEKLCVLEENRFVRQVARRTREFPDGELTMVMENLESEFDPGGYEALWNTSGWQRIRSAWNKAKEE